MQNGIDLIDDRRFDPEFLRALEGAACRWDALGDGFHPARNLGHRFPFAELFAHLPIAAVPTEAGRDKIARSA